MRCLTLAHAFHAQGVNCQFVCREHPGNIITYIEEQGFLVLRLPNSGAFHNSAALLAHADWLGVSQEQDAAEMMPFFSLDKNALLVVDHYALDEQWERQVRPYVNKILVIDDLADRRHDCDWLLDHNLGRVKEDYQHLVPESCQLLIGLRYALLRPEFDHWRGYSLQRRQLGELKTILISLGGVDKDNITAQVLIALQQIHLPDEIKITVILGATNPHLDSIKKLAEQMINSTQVRVNVQNMAEAMSNSDLAIGAGGITSWERCCLGLPSVVLQLADNQRNGLQALARQGCVVMIENASHLLPVIENFLHDKNALRRISQDASALVLGGGAHNVVTLVMDKKCDYSLRPMQLADLPIVRSWRNHPAVRNYMFQQDEISEHEHRQWFANKQQDANTHLLIFEKNNEPIGFLNLKINKLAVIDWGFYLSPSAQGGLGKKLGKMGVEYCFNELKAEAIFGEVLVSNIRSQKLHERLGFIRLEADQNKKDVCSYLLKRNQYAGVKYEKNNDQE